MSAQSFLVLAFLVSVLGRGGEPVRSADAEPPRVTAPTDPQEQATELDKAFVTPPEAARPWVYWMFMDGNLTREGMTADLEAMQRAGIGGAIILEVNLGIPRGPVVFASEAWRELIRHAIHEADRLGLEIALPAGPGWCGTGGPWVKPEQSMQHLVASETKTTGPTRFDAMLSRPQPRTPFFGEATLTPELHKLWKEFYQDVVVLAFPTPTGSYQIPDIGEKALYFRPPYSSQPGVKPFLAADRTVLPAAECIPANRIVELTAQLAPDGRLVWDVPAGNWTILRFGRTTTGQTSRPAPTPGLGLESDKFDQAALDAHFDSFLGTLLKTVGAPRNRGRGLTTVHFDSWEMSSQNWSEKFRDEFRQRRGYDLLRFLPVMLGHAVDSVAVSERFLWDLRRTAQELVVENHALRLKELGHRQGLTLSIEPYDLNPAGDLTLGSAADVPMGEFWSKGYGFSTEFSCFEAVSIAHTMGRPVVGAEAFTSHGDAWRQHPGSIKQQGDWALCAGINRLVFHRYQHQPWLDRFPGLTFGPYGVHWDRTETWWDLARGYHTYLARCQALLRRGVPVADVLYLDREGAPNAFRPPISATLTGFPDRRGYNFDGCAPGTLIDRAAVKDGRIVFPDGMSYRLLVLPRAEAMTPELLRKLQQLAGAGATLIGTPPQHSPSLESYPQCDAEVQRLAAEVWQNPRVIRDGSVPATRTAAEHPLTNAKWIWHGEDKPAVRALVGKRYFRRELELAGCVASATFTMTADNGFELFVNGRAAGTGNNFHQEYTLDVAPLLKPGPNAIAVTADNGGEQPNPAGLIGALAIRFPDGKTLSVVTDGQWSSALTPDGDRRPALELGAWNMAPWKLPGTPPLPESYPSYGTTAETLAKLKVPPDFESDGDLRYIHRFDNGTDIYFVGNRTDAPVCAEGRFRVAGRQPELWDPVTGEQRALPEFSEQDGRTTVPLSFAPRQSYFVVFRKPLAGTDRPAVAPAGTAPRARARANFPHWKCAAELTGPWQVAFDPKWGGPERVTWDALDDWSKRAEEGIQFYSGKARYEKRLRLDPSALKQPLCLDLGNVAVMAQAKLNGQDLGIVWCPPWRVRIPPGLLRADENTLEVTVANLWCNRLIGDSALPAERRRTWTTYQPFQPGSPLLPSGLLGPVRVMTEE